MAWLREIVIDCDHPASLARFWAAAIDGYAVRAYDDAEIARLAQPTTYQTKYYDMIYAEINPTQMQQNADQVRAANGIHDQAHAQEPGRRPARPVP